MTPAIKFRLMFFDTNAVKTAIDRRTRRALSRYGAFVRTRARSSIRKRKKVATPGTPPSSHAGDLKRLIFFAFEPVEKSVVIGPVPFKEGTAPALLEEGGRTTVHEDGRARVRHYREFPFMGPADQKERPKLSTFFSDSGGK